MMRRVTTTRFQLAAERIIYCSHVAFSKIYLALIPSRSVFQLAAERFIVAVMLLNDILMRT